jgi:hypothetical protein
MSQGAKYVCLLFGEGLRPRRTGAGLAVKILADHESGSMAWLSTQMKSSAWGRRR